MHDLHISTVALLFIMCFLYLLPVALITHWRHWHPSVLMQDIKCRLNYWLWIQKKAWSIQMIHLNKYINASAGKPDPSYCYNQTFLLHPPFPIWVHTCGCMSLHSISWDASSNRMQMQTAINTIHIFISVCCLTLLKICYSGQNKAKNHLLPRFDPKIYSL